MNVRVQMPENIYRYEHKVLGNFTARQLICGGIALAIIFPVFLTVFLKTGSPRLAVLLSTAASFPALACSVFKKDGQYLEQILRYRWRQKFKYPQKRKFVMHNLYEIIQQSQKEYETADEEQEQRREGKKNHSFFPLSLGKKKHRPGKHSV